MIAEGPPSQAERDYTNDLESLEILVQSIIKSAMKASASMNVSARKAFMVEALADIGVEYGAHAADIAYDYLRETAKIGEDIDLSAPSPDELPNEKFWDQESRYAVWAEDNDWETDEGLSGSTYLMMALGAKIVWKVANDFLARRARGELSVRVESGVCSYCSSTAALESAIPPFHRVCRCRLVRA